MLSPAISNSSSSSSSTFSLSLVHSQNLHNHTLQVPVVTVLSVHKEGKDYAAVCFVLAAPL